MTHSALGPAALVAGTTGFAFEDDLHVLGNGDEQRHHDNLALARMLDQHQGDARFAVDVATGEIDVAIVRVT